MVIAGDLGNNSVITFAMEFEKQLVSLDENTKVFDSVDTRRTNYTTFATFTLQTTNDYYTEYTIVYIAEINDQLCLVMFSMDEVYYSDYNRAICDDIITSMHKV